MEADKLQSLRTGGLVLAISSLAAVVLMHHHPHGTDGAGMIRAVHGGLLAVILVQPAVLALLGRAIGWNLLTALATTAFAVGTLGALIAGTINGFVVPAIWTYPEGDIGPGVGELLWELNQNFARNGAIATGTGIAMFGVALWRAGWRAVGALGVLAGALPAALLLAGVTDMRFYGAMLTYIAQLTWLVGLGGTLFWQARRAG